MCVPSSAMYSFSAASGLFARYSLMSSRTLPRRLDRSRASLRLDRRRARSRRWLARVSRRSDRLFCLTAEDVRAASESNSRASWVIVESRCSGLARRHCRFITQARAPFPVAPQSCFRSRAPPVTASWGYSSSSQTGNRCGSGSGSTSIWLTSRRPRKLTGFSLLVFRDCALAAAAGSSPGFPKVET